MTFGTNFDAITRLARTGNARIHRSLREQLRINVNKLLQNLQGQKYTDFKVV